MQRISGSTALANANGTGKTGFEDLNKALGILGTIVSADWLNAVQEEICTVIEVAGLTLDPADRTQLSQAIKAMISLVLAAASETQAGIVKLASVEDAKNGVGASTVVTPAGLKAAVSAAVTALVNSAPGTLDTLNELATALGDDANFAGTVTTALALKAPLASPALTGIPTAPTATAGTSTTQLATTAFVAAALAATLTGYAKLAVAQTWTKPQSCAVVTLTDAASIVWDLSAGQMFEVTIAASRTLAAPTNQTAGTMYQLRVIHGAANTTLAFAATYTGVSSLVMSTTASAVDALTFRSNGTTMELVGVALAVGA